jgi:hypothetical protein
VTFVVEWRRASPPLENGWLCQQVVLWQCVAPVAFAIPPLLALAVLLPLNWAFSPDCRV